jgi:hypothetical protein
MRILWENYSRRLSIPTQINCFPLICCHVLRSPSLRPTCIPHGNYIPTQVKMKHTALYGRPNNIIVNCRCQGSMQWWLLHQAHSKAKLPCVLSILVRLSLGGGWGGFFWVEILTYFEIQQNWSKTHVTSFEWSVENDVILKSRVVFAFFPCQKLC